MHPVLIIAAVPQEAALLRNALGNAPLVEARGFPYFEGALGRLTVAICVAGIGKINAAAASAALIERIRPQLVINTGCAGAYPGSGLDIGALAVACSELLGDEGASTSAGWLDLLEMNMPSLVHGNRRYYNDIPLSRHPLEKAVKLAEDHGIDLVQGRFVTVSTCSGSLDQGEKLARRFDAICENMEGGAIALTCLRYGIDCLEIRGISNWVEERNMASWDIPGAVEAAQRFVLKYLERMDRTASNR